MDGGTTWKELTGNPGLPKSNVLGKITIAVGGGDSNRLYAMVEAKDGGLFRSDDGGATWAAVNGERRLWQRAFYFIRMSADPVDRDTMYVLNFELLKSVDGGKTFKPMAETPRRSSRSVDCTERSASDDQQQRRRRQRVHQWRPDLD